MLFLAYSLFVLSTLSIASESNFLHVSKSCLGSSCNGSPYWRKILPNGFSKKNVCQLLNCQFFVDIAETGIINAPVFWAAFITPGLGTLSGPLGPSGVIPMTEEGCLSILIISTKRNFF